MKENCKEFVFVIGKSEGMNQEKIIEGFNNLVECQRKIKDESIFTLVTFNDECKVSASGKSMNQMRKYTPKTYSPRGRSALLDAIGTAIDLVGERLSETSEWDMPNGVVVIIIGEEDNASTVYDYEHVNSMINLQKYTYKWDFVLYSNTGFKFDINKGGNLENEEKIFDVINMYIANLRTAGR